MGIVKPSICLVCDVAILIDILVSSSFFLVGFFSSEMREDERYKVYFQHRIILSYPSPRPPLF